MSNQPQEPLGYIYLTINRVSGRAYIGQRVGRFCLKYKGSGVAIRDAFKAYGRSAFSVFPLEFCNTQEELDSAERDHISIYRFYGADLYNIAPGGKRSFGHSPSQETREKISAKLTGQKRSWGTEEERAMRCAKISLAKNGKKNRPPCKEWLERLAARMTGWKMPPRTFDNRLAGALCRLGKTTKCEPVRTRNIEQKVNKFLSGLPSHMRTPENEELVRFSFEQKLSNVLK